jgi:hypothetical protein
MQRSLIGLALALTFAIAGAGAAMAATQEFTFTVPLTLKGLTGPGSTGVVPPGGITVSCAVGRGSLAYSTAEGSATGANGLGSTKVNLAGLVKFPMDVKVVVTDTAPTDPQTGVATGKGASQYLCWGKLDKGTTPVNFISGDIK